MYALIRDRYPIKVESLQDNEVNQDLLNPFSFIVHKGLLPKMSDHLDVIAWISRILLLSVLMSPNYHQGRLQD